MITFKDLVDETPYKKFSDYYRKAIENNQISVEAIAISSFNPLQNQVNSRFVNLKYIHQDEWIFFSNYKSEKAKEFESFPIISALIYWNSINVQIRIKAKIFKSDHNFSDEHFKKRSNEKNALAVSSMQSKEISSFKKVKENYKNVLKNISSTERPDYWGGYSFIPHYFEFWEGANNRLNKREVFELLDSDWTSYYLQP
tara:strand:+ start:1132 stop:1728 length:597 start_codon:yes stop_codon:yes gene_type:complete